MEMSPYQKISFNVKRFEGRRGNQKKSDSKYLANILESVAGDGDAGVDRRAASAYPACPVALQHGTGGFKFLPNEIFSLFHRGFQRKTSVADLSANFCKGFNRGLPC